MVQRCLIKRWEVALRAPCLDDDDLSEVRLLFIIGDVYIILDNNDGNSFV